MGSEYLSFTSFNRSSRYDQLWKDFESALDKLDQKTKEKYGKDIDNFPGLFASMKPMPGAIEAFNFLSKHFDTYILSTAPWENPTAWIDDRLKHGVPEFEGEHIHFGEGRFKKWGDVLKYICDKEGIKL